MLIIIDAYNYMKVISGDKHISQQAEREHLNVFQQYVRQRGNRLMLVFDAGPALHKGDEMIGGVHVVYSGHLKSADDVIIEFIQDRAGADILVVTSDREIRTVAKQCNIVSISSVDFHKIFTEVMKFYEGHEKKVVKSAIKTTEESNSDLDLLMELGSRSIVSSVKKELVLVPRHVKNDKKVSKADKWAMRKINKI